MSLFGIIGGAMAGGGAAWNQYARDEAETERRAKLEAIRSANDMARQKALEDLRHANAIAMKQYDNSPEAIEGAVGRAKAVKQAEMDIAIDPKYVDAEVSKAGAIAKAQDENKSYDLKPGEQRYRGKEQLASNANPAYEDKMISYYRERDAAARAERDAQDKKLPPAYVSEMKPLIDESKDLQDRIRDMQGDAATKTDIDKAGAEKQIATWEKQLRDNQRRQYVTQAKHGQIDPEQEARRLAKGIEHTGQLNTIIESASRDVGPDWARQLSDAFGRTGVLEKVYGLEKESEAAIQGAAPDQSAAESKRLGGIIGSRQKPLPPQNQPTDLFSEKFDQEAREMALGKRRDHSPELQAEIDARKPPPVEVTPEQKGFLENPGGSILSGGVVPKATEITPESASKMTPEQAERLLASPSGRRLPKQIQDILRSLVR